MQFRIIPASAGNTNLAPYASYMIQDHPRIRGEHLENVDAFSKTRGIIPASAGNTYFIRSYEAEKRDHPRIRGEHLHFWVM